MWVNYWRHVGVVHGYSQQRAVHTLHIEFVQTAALRRRVTGGAGGGGCKPLHLQPSAVERSSHCACMCV